jgi:hypothetical protein
MNLFELPLTAVAGGPGLAPDWVTGCFVRRSITFFTGATDSTTVVVWIQSRGLTFDLRLSPGRPRVESIGDIARLEMDDLALLADAEGGLARSTFVSSGSSHAGSMNWTAWVRAQVHDGWPEPGELRRAGDCLVEFAPSGAYVEDWRAQRSAKGMLVGLVLLSEIDADSGTLLHGGGGLIVAGDHAGLVRGRPAALPKVGRLVDLVRANPGNAALLKNVFRFEASYATRREGGDYVVAASTLPYREGQPLMSLDGFSLQGDVLVQRAAEGPRLVERRFRIETCEPFAGAVATEAAPEAEGWLEQERRTLLRNAR